MNVAVSPPHTHDGSRNSNCTDSALAVLRGAKTGMGKMEHHLGLIDLEWGLADG